METSSSTTETYTSFPNIIEIIFNNWTAVKLALEHGMGGPPDVAARKLNAMVEAVSQLLSKGNVDWCDVSDLLTDIMDAEFCTILEDNSTDEVGVHLCRLHQMFSSGNFQALHTAIISLPNRTPINFRPPLQRTPYIQADDSTGNDTETEEPEEDMWTLVKKK